MYNKLIKFSLIVSLALFSFGFLSNFNNVKAATGTLVATVNILDAEITSQDGGTINGVFTLSNREGVQSGVRYGVQLVSRSSKGDFVVDEKIFDERLQLPENVSLRKSFSYTTPNTLNGKYTLLLVSRNSSNFPFATKVLGEVTLKSSVSGILISPESCVASFDGSTNKTPITPTSALVLNSASQVVNISCTATNLSSSPVTASLNVNTKLQSAFGENVDTPLANPVSFSFKASEKKTISFVLPVAKSPQKYFADISLVSGNNSLGSFSFAYLVPGSSATISNISLDKDFYKRGETAALSMVWYSGTPRLSVEATLKNGSGFDCAKDIKNEIAPSTIELLFPVTSTCRDPHVLVSLKDASGNVLDSKDFSVTTTSTNEGKNNTPFILVVVLAALIIVGIYVKKHKSHSDDLPNTSNPVNPMMAMLPIIFVAGLLSLVPFSSAYADTYWSTGPGGSQCISTIVDVVPRNYFPNEDIKVTWKIENNCSASVPVTMRATNDIGAGVANPTSVLMAPVTITAPGNTGVLPIEDFLTFDAPGQEGSYKIVFETGVDIQFVYVKIVEVSNDSGSISLECGTTGNYEFYPYSHGTYRAEFYEDPQATIPMDVSGLNFKLRQEHAINIPAGVSSNPGSEIVLIPVASGTSYTYTSGFDAGYTLGYGQSSCDQMVEVYGYGTLEGSDLTPTGYMLIPELPIVNMSAPGGSYQNEQFNITWNSQNATSCTGTGFNTGGNTSGSVAVSQSSATTYSVTCSNVLGNDSASRTVVDWGPLPPPVVSCNQWPGMAVQCDAPNVCDVDPVHSGFEICVP